MIGAEERRRLMERAGDEPARALAAVVKCAAGCAVLVLITAGPWVFVSRVGTTAGEQATAQAPRSTGPAVAESRRVHEARRERFGERPPEAKKSAAAEQP